MSKITIKKVLQSIDNDLKRLERKICNWVNNLYGHNFQVSIQLMYSAQFIGRPPPCNKRCRAIYSSECDRELCDKSDMAMKDLLYSQIDKPASAVAIGYMCHQKLSNVVIPIYDDTCVTGTYWFIFLGQFHLINCPMGGKEGKGQICEPGLNAGNIRALTREEVIGMPNRFDGCVFSGLSDDCINNSEDVSSVSVPELIAIKVKAEETLKLYFADTNRSEANRKKMIKWVDYFEGDAGQGTKKISRARLPKEYDHD